MASVYRSTCCPSNVPNGSLVIVGRLSAIVLSSRRGLVAQVAVTAVWQRRVQAAREWCVHVGLPALLGMDAPREWPGLRARSFLRQHDGVGSCESGIWSRREMSRLGSKRQDCSGERLVPISEREFSTP